MRKKSANLRYEQEWLEERFEIGSLDQFHSSSAANQSNVDLGTVPDEVKTPEASDGERDDEPPP
jgi:hypothetical protein